MLSAVVCREPIITDNVVVFTFLLVNGLDKQDTVC